MLVLLCIYIVSQCTQICKTGIFECCSRLDLPIFPNSWKRLKIGICKCWPIGSTSKFSQIPKEIENWDEWVLKRNHQMNKEWKLEVFNWIFNPLRTANLNIFFNPVEWNFYHFRRVSSDISKGWMVIVNINWLKRLPISEKSFHNFFDLKRYSVWTITLGCAYKNTIG